jgi:protein-tyrosine phosphatase
MGASIQKAASGNRRRTKENGFDLDLTYITDDVVAMSLPSHGIKKYLRIDGKKVSKYFKQKYNDESMSNVMIYNLSGRKYNYQHFNNRVKEFGFPNHGVPTMKHLWRIITDMKSQNCVTVVHCKAGKGRTGSIIASYLLINGECTTADESIKLFNSVTRLPRIGIRIQRKLTIISIIATNKRRKGRSSAIASEIYPLYRRFSAVRTRKYCSRNF